MTPTRVTSTSVRVTTPISSPSLSSAAASSTSSSQPSSTANVGGIVGGIAGGLVGLVLIVFLIKFLVVSRDGIFSIASVHSVLQRRQARKNETNGGIFNPNEFRRSAVLMTDPPTHEDTVARGFNPRPPSMIERRFASPAPTFGMQQGVPSPHFYNNNSLGNEYAAADPYGQHPSFGPGQIMNNVSPHSAQPVHQNPGYGQSPFSPGASPVSSIGPYNQGYNGRQDVAPALTRQSSAGTQLTRQGSGGSHGYQSYNPVPGPAPQAVDYSAPVVLASQPRGGPSSSEYVDLNRMSVTPFQAAQYAEISQKLNTEVPNGMVTPAVAKYVQHTEEHNLSANEGYSPFADPIPESLIPARAPHDSLLGQDVDRPVSSVSADSRSIVSVTHDLNFPAPPSPALTVASRFRVDSSPPTLPEINVESRADSSFGGGISNGLRFPAPPSGLSSSFTIPSPSAEHESAPVASPVAVAAESESSAKQPMRPETVYDPQDAYGGI